MRVNNNIRMISIYISRFSFSACLQLMLFHFYLSCISISMANPSERFLRKKNKEKQKLFETIRDSDKNEEKKKL